jgi:hypothetical protein
MNPAPKSLFAPVPEILRRRVVFVSGKGGVGKTTVARAAALASARSGRRALLVALEDPILPRSELRSVGKGLFHLNLDAGRCFEEYVALKIGSSTLARILLGNNVVRYLARAAPGIHELVLLGKLWNDRFKFDQIFVDMPSTGYGLTMFQSVANFAKLFQGGPVNRDAEAMLRSFGDPVETGHLIVALPEEMPLQEALELRALLAERFQVNPPGFIVNRLFPESQIPQALPIEPPSEWKNPVPSSAADYSRKRRVLEEFNLRIWKAEGLEYGSLPFVPPEPELSSEALVGKLADLLAEVRREPAA